MHTHTPHDKRSAWGACIQRKGKDTMTIQKLSKRCYRTFTDIEFIFKKNHDLFPEELYMLLIDLGYEETYAFSVIQKGMDKATKEFKKGLSEWKDVENCPF